MEFRSVLSSSEEVPFVGAVPGTGNAVQPEQERLLAKGAALWIGPEGGFASEEQAALLEAGAVALTVGRWILRVETAVPALLGRLDGILSAFQPKNGGN